MNSGLLRTGIMGVLLAMRINEKVASATLAVLSLALVILLFQAFMWL